MIAAIAPFDDRCQTCGHFPRAGYYVVGTQPQCRECYELAAARTLYLAVAVGIGIDRPYKPLKVPKKQRYQRSVGI